MPAATIVVNDGDITVTACGVRFGHSPGRMSTGDLVMLLGLYQAARFSNRDASQAVYRQICWKCNGSGFLSYYAGIYSGVCFPCNGVGLGKLVSQGSPEDVVKVLRSREAAKARRAAKKQAEQQAKAVEHATWAAAHLELVTQAAQVKASVDAEEGIFGPLLLKLADQAGHTPLSAAQATLFSQLYQEDLATQAAKAAATRARRWLGEKGDKITVTGKVVYTRHDFFEVRGYDRSSTVMILVDADGNSVEWRRSGYYEIERWTVLTVTAKVKDLKETAKYGKCTVIFHGKLSETASA
jgi:hypothetical protein